MMGGFGWIFMLLLVVVGVALALGLLRDQFDHRRNRDGAAGRTALDILDERYARGEIDVEDYKRRRADLMSH